MVEVKQHLVHIDEKTKDISEFVFRQLRNYLIVEIVLANAQRSGIIEGMLIKKVLDAEGNAKCNDLIQIIKQDLFKLPLFISMLKSIINLSL